MTLDEILLGAFSAFLALAANATPSLIAPQTQTSTIFTEIARNLTVIIAAVAAAVAAMIAKERYNVRSLKSLSSERRKAVTGTWQGTAANLSVAGDEPLPMEFNIIFHLTARRKTVKGYAIFQHDGDYTVDVKGGFHSESYLKLEYLHRQGIVGFGYMILHLDDHAKSMAGKVVAYGAKSHKIVVGRVELKKV